MSPAAAPMPVEGNIRRAAAQVLPSASGRERTRSAGDTIRTWLVRATDPGFEAFLEHRVAALNCLVRRDITDLPTAEVREIGPSKRHSRELARLLDVAPGQFVIATHGRRRDVLVGTVAGGHSYRPDLITDHPHTVDVVWSECLPRRVLDEAGMHWPRLDVLAITEMELPSAALDRVSAAARGGGVPQAAGLARASGQGTAGSVIPHYGCGADLLARAPRRIGRPVSWTDSQLSSGEPTSACPTGRCANHTRHRYWLEIDLAHPRPDGPNVLVVGLNPACPDGPANATYKQVQRLARAVGAASCGMVNLATRRASNAEQLRELSDELVGDRQWHMVRRALAQADLVILAYGREGGAGWLRGPRDHLLALLDVERRRGVTVAQVGDYPAHPIRGGWPPESQGDHALAAALRTA